MGGSREDQSGQLAQALGDSGTDGAEGEGLQGTILFFQNWFGK